MAQKREKEETELKVPESLSLCAQPIGSPPAKISSSGGVSDEHNSNSSTVRSSERSDLKGAASVDFRSSIAISPERTDLLFKVGSTEVENRMKRRDVNRCSGCRKRVGLMGFRCRCGEMFCSEHRYSDRHDCSFDYKAAGREAIARENPVVRAAKILKV